MKRSTNHIHTSRHRHRVAAHAAWLAAAILRRQLNPDQVARHAGLLRLYARIATK